MLGGRGRWGGRPPGAGAAASGGARPAGGGAVRAPGAPSELRSPEAVRAGDDFDDEIRSRAPAPPRYA